MAMLVQPILWGPPSERPYPLFAVGYLIPLYSVPQPCKSFNLNRLLLTPAITTATSTPTPTPTTTATAASSTISISSVATTAILWLILLLLFHDIDDFVGDTEVFDLARC